MLNYALSLFLLTIQSIDLFNNHPDEISLTKIDSEIVLDGKTSKLTPISDVMTRKVVCVTADRTADECMALMTEKRVRHLPVVDKKNVLALISIGDVVREMISDQRHTIEQLEQYIMS